MADFNVIGTRINPNDGIEEKQVVRGGQTLYVPIDMSDNDIMHVYTSLPDQKVHPDDFTRNNVERQKKKFKRDFLKMRAEMARTETAERVQASKDSALKGMLPGLLGAGFSMTPVGKGVGAAGKLSGKALKFAQSQMAKRAAIGGGTGSLIASASEGQDLSGAAFDASLAAGEQFAFQRLFDKVLSPITNKAGEFLGMYFSRFKLLAKIYDTGTIVMATDNSESKYFDYFNFENIPNGPFSTHEDIIKVGKIVGMKNICIDLAHLYRHYKNNKKIIIHPP